MFKVGDVVRFNKECKLRLGSFKPDFNNSYIIEDVSEYEPYFISLQDIDEYVFDQRRFIYEVVFYRNLKIQKLKQLIDDCK